jgi:hypothetical protein
MTLGLVLIVTVTNISCYRERVSDREPIHINPNMDNQPKTKPQSVSGFFDDGAAMRQPVAGTVARGDLREDVVINTGKDASGMFVMHSPLPFTKRLMQRGRESFNVYCAPCHSRVGDGRGIMIEYKYPPPPSFHQERILQMPDGQVFDVITNGVRNMPSYRHQVPVPDRWAIISYLRALQRSQNATAADVPAEILDSIGEK